MKKFVASPYIYNKHNKPTSWGIWDTEMKSWTIDVPCKRKKDAEKVAQSLNNYPICIQ